MAERSGKRRRNKILIHILSVIAVLAAVFLIFLGVFYVPDDHVDVSGNTKYTADEVREMVLTDFAHHNSVYLSKFVKTVTPDGVPFVNSIEIEYEAHNRIALHVNENNPIGYISQNGNDYYFDAKGYILESMPSSETSDTAAASDAGTGTESVVSSSAGNALQSSSETTDAAAPAAGIASSAPDSVSSSSSPSRGAALQADMVRTQDTEYHPALTDVTEVTGLTDEQLSVGMTISVGDTSVFSSLLALTKIISKLDIIPDSIEVTNGNEFTLHYGDIRIMLGTDSLLEKKMARVAAILPRLSGLKGVLHLEDFSDDTVNIIFDKDTGDTSADSTSTDSTSTDSISADSTSESDTASDTSSAAEYSAESDTVSDTAADGTASGADTSADTTPSDSGTDAPAGDTSGTGESDSGTDEQQSGDTDTSGTDTSGGNAAYGGYLY